MSEGSDPGPADAEGGEETISTEVPALLGGVRVDRGVAMVADVSRGTAAHLIAEGRVHVDGAAVTVGRSVLREGSTLTIVLPAPVAVGVRAEPGVAFDVVYADDAVAVVDKPAGLVVHPGAGHDEGTLVGGLLARFPDLAGLVAAGVCPPDRPGIVHRLDKGTSGLLAVARTEAAYRALVDQLATRTMERRYLALVVGTVADDRGEVEAPIGRSTRTPTKMAVTASGKPARTGYTVLERRSGEQPTTLLELALQSGRTHQIRVHMAAIGHPVVGDARYGTPDKRLGSGRFFLHAFKLGFLHPDTGARIDFTSPLPEDLRTYLG
ncbi:MAG TPA: RluA family pseudouridine synthase [Acidimicrobiales bacterium]|jgi:23S rRNA pseudouridine1911/1915/1917 synthase|nr:RluA family pseudouridine synthase [Acidimicrobiales bacterium]